MSVAWLYLSFDFVSCVLFDKYILYSRDLLGRDVQFDTTGVCLSFCEAFVSLHISHWLLVPEVAVAFSALSSDCMGD